MALALRLRCVLLATAPTQDGRAACITEFRPGQTLALYMGVAQYGELGDALIASGYDRSTPVAVVENGTTERQRVVRCEVPCGPCHQELCPVQGAEQHACMHRIDPERVAASGLELLARSSADANV